MRPGDAVNLLHGLTRNVPIRKARIPSLGELLTPPPRAPLVVAERQAEPPGDGTWDDPKLSLHETVEELVDEIFDLRVQPFTSDPSPFQVYPSAFLLADDSLPRTPRGREVPPELTPRGSRRARLQALGRHLGVELGREGDRYLLLSVRRGDGFSEHDLSARERVDLLTHWTRGGRNAMGRLRRAKSPRGKDWQREVDIRHRQAYRYLDFFYEQGTHFVARVERGNRLFQVYVCDGEQYPGLRGMLYREAGTPATGESLRLPPRLAAALRPLLTAPWIRATGEIVGWAGAERLAASRAAGDWADPEPGSEECLLYPFADDGKAGRRLLEGLEGRAPVAVELASLAEIMESFRGRAWQRLLHGALAQRFGRGIVVLPASGAEAPESERGSGAHFPPVGGPAARWWEDVLDVGECRVAGDEPLEEARVHCLELRIPPAAETRLAARRVEIQAVRTVAPAAQNRLPELRIGGHDLDAFRLHTSAVEGAFRLRDATGLRRQTVWEGVRLVTEWSGEAGDLPRIALGDDPRCPPDEPSEDGESEVRGEAWISALEAVEAWIHLGSAAGGEELLIEACRCLEWASQSLEAFPAAHPVRRELARLRELADRGCGSPSAISSAERARLVEVADDVYACSRRLALEMEHRRAQGRAGHPETLRALRADLLRHAEDLDAVLRPSWADPQDCADGDASRGVVTARRHLARRLAEIWHRFATESDVPTPEWARSGRAPDLAGLADAVSRAAAANQSSAVEASSGRSKTRDT